MGFGWRSGPCGGRRAECLTSLREGTAAGGCRASMSRCCQALLPNLTTSCPPLPSPPLAPALAAQLQRVLVGQLGAGRRPVQCNRHLHRWAQVRAYGSTCVRAHGWLAVGGVWLAGWLGCLRPQWAQAAARPAGRAVLAGVEGPGGCAHPLIWPCFCPSSSHRHPLTRPCWLPSSHPHPLTGPSWLSSSHPPAGMWTVRHFGSKHYNWRGLSQQQTLLAKARRGLAQFTPATWDRRDWGIFRSPTRLLQCFFPGGRGSRWCGWGRGRCWCCARVAWASWLVGVGLGPSAPPTNTLCRALTDPLPPVCPPTCRAVAIILLLFELNHFFLHAVLPLSC